MDGGDSLALARVSAGRSANSDRLEGSCAPPKPKGKKLDTTDTTVTGVIDSFCGTSHIHTAVYDHAVSLILHVLGI